jgi:hypothetical protein
VASEKQNEANRLNAFKGGPKTEAGKAAVRLNAVSHGLLCKETLLPGEDGCRLAALRRQYLEELQPVGELENLLVDRIASSTWRLKRAVHDVKRQVRTGCDHGFGSWDVYMRYETALERQIFKALHELQDLQTSRLAKADAAAQAAGEEALSPEEKAAAEFTSNYFKNSPLFNDES